MFYKNTLASGYHKFIEHIIYSCLMKMYSFFSGYDR